MNLDTGIIGLLPLKTNSTDPDDIKDEICKASKPLCAKMDDIIKKIKDCQEAIEDEDKCQEATKEMVCFEIEMTDNNVINAIIIGMKETAERKKDAVCEEQEDDQNDATARQLTGKLIVGPYDLIISDGKEEEINDKLKIKY